MIFVTLWKVQRAEIYRSGIKLNLGVTMKLRNLLIIALTALSSFIVVNAEDAKNNDMMASMSYPMQKSMDPQVWSQMMAMMMDPAKAMSMESCALCHEGDDLARYAKDFGPMMEASQQMAQYMSPHQMMQGMTPMMNMMNPMAMMYPMMGMMGPMMGMMNPMMMGMMNPMAMMNPMTMMNPMAMMNPMTMMNPMMGGGGMGGYSHGNPMGQMMKPDQYTDWFNQMSEMMKQFTPAQPDAQ